MTDPTSTSFEDPKATLAAELGKEAAESGINSTTVMVLDIIFVLIIGVRNLSVLQGVDGGQKAGIYSIDQGSPCPLATLNPFGRELLLLDVFAGLKRSTRIKRIL
jgi:hypothetical protein